MKRSSTVGKANGHQERGRRAGAAGADPVPEVAGPSPAEVLPNVRLRRRAESLEAMTLSPYATLSTAAGDRQQEEPEDPYRTALQRDRDRILHANAFRALQHKTQVFVVHEGDRVRTRLTHTLEVAQIARSLSGYLGANSDLAEAITLAHDLGHAPFGHAGEEELSDLMQAHGRPAFDHNFASLRIVTQLEERRPGLPGLNLTFATREGIARHETAYDRPAAVKAYYVSPQPGIEAQIANVADPLAYTTHDLEDALRLRFFEEEELLDLGLDIVSEAYRQASRDVASVMAVERRAARARVMHRRLIHRLLTEMLVETSGRLAGLRTDGAAPTADQVRAAERPVVGFPDGVQDQVQQLRLFLHRRVYRHPTVMDMCTKGRRILRALFEHYLERPGNLPRRVQARWGGGPPPALSGRADVVCDYLAGLTDRGAMDLHRRLFDPYERTLVNLGHDGIA